MSKKQRGTKPKIQPYLPEDLHKQFKTYCAARGLSESSVVEAALREYFDETKDMRLILRRLDRQSRAVGRLERDQGLLAEAFAVFVQLWFAHTPQLDPSEKEAAQKFALNRYERYIDHVAQQVARGSRFVDDLAQDQLTDEELKEAAEDDYE